MKVVYIVYLVFTFISVQAQDSLFYQTESKKFYDKEYKDWSKIYRPYALEILSKYDRSPLITERDSFRNEYFRKLRDTLKAKIDNKMQFKTELVDSLLEYRLMLWNFRKGQIPDSTFLILINSYFNIDQKGAIEFCMQNWSVQKAHKMDRTEFHEIPWTKNFPYISYLFDKLSSSELLELFVLILEPDTERNELLSKLCYRELVYNKPEVQKEIMKQYIDYFIKVNSIKKYNNEFVIFFNSK
jgi:hypothetical protein